MLFHFGWTALPGGYLGVDVFFVLSGFLIAGILLRRFDRPGGPGLTDFWLRRARRLLPALGLMLIVVAMVTSFAPPLEQKTVFGQGIATLLYSNNWYLIFTDTAYFDQLQDASPLLHTWTLGVEEQWYVVFPIALLAFVYFSRTKPGRIAVGLLAAAVVSAGWGAYLTISGESIERVYFGTDVRCQELLIGAALAAAFHHAPTRQRLRTWLGGVRSWIGWAGIAVLGLMLVFVHGDQRWQYSFGLFILALAIAAVIWAAMETKGSLAMFLAWKPLAYIGLISYGLYLWHWPLYVWFSGGQQSFGAAQILSVMILTAGAALASYYWLELPIRHQRWQWTHNRRGLYLLVITPLCLAALLSACTQDRRDVVGSDQHREVYEAGGYDGQGPKVFLLGDSIGDNLRASFGAVPDPGFSLTGTTYLGCGLLPNGLVVGGELRPNDMPCAAWAKQWPKDIINRQPDLTIVTSPIQFRHNIIDDNGRELTFGTPEYLQFYLDSMDRTIAAAQAGSKQVAVMNAMCNAVPEGNQVASELNDPNRQLWINGATAQLLERHPDVALIDISGWDCGQSPAQARQLAAERKYDGLHYSKQGSLEAWAQLAPQIRALLGESPQREVPSG